MTIKHGMTFDEMISILTGEEQVNADYCLRRFEETCEPCPETLPEHTLRSAQLEGVAPVSRNSTG